MSNRTALETSFTTSTTTNTKQKNEKKNPPQKPEKSKLPGTFQVKICRTNLMHDWGEGHPTPCKLKYNTFKNTVNKCTSAAFISKNDALATAHTSRMVNPTLRQRSWSD